LKLRDARRVKNTKEKVTLKEEKKFEGKIRFRQRTKLNAGKGKKNISPEAMGQIHSTIYGPLRINDPKGKLKISGKGDSKSQMNCRKLKER